MSDCTCNNFPASLGNVTFGATVGIGTTDPQAQLEICNNASQYTRINGWSTDIVGNNNSKTLFTVTGSGAADLLNLVDGSTTVFTVRDGGNVGIGTTNPGARLDVVGNIQLSATDGASRSIGVPIRSGSYQDNWPGYDLSVYSGAALQNGANSTAGGKLKLFGGDGYGTVGAGGPVLIFGGAGAASVGNVILAHTGSEARGNVGIGTATPSERLEVNGNIKASGKLNLATGTDLGVVFGATDCGIYAFPNMAPASRMDLKAGTVVIFGNNSGIDGGVTARIGGQGSFRVRDIATQADKVVVDSLGSVSLSDPAATDDDHRGGAISQIHGMPYVGITSNGYSALIFNYNSSVRWAKGTQGGDSRAGGAQMMLLEENGSLWFGPDQGGRRAIDSQGRCLYA